MPMHKNKNKNKTCFSSQNHYSFDQQDQPQEGKKISNPKKLNFKQPGDVPKTKAISKTRNTSDKVFHERLNSSIYVQSKAVNVLSHLNATLVKTLENKNEIQ